MHTLISATDLQALLRATPQPVLLDCSFDLTQPEAGLAAWQQGHLPGAAYMHLDRDLSGPKHDAQGRFQGRHPLPDRKTLAQTLGQWGVTPERFVVAYDAQGGCYAARAWWLLRWMGHEQVVVLDGGIAAWREAGGVVHTQATRATPAPASPPYPAREPGMPTLDADAVQQQLGTLRLLDARAGERFRGEVEPLDAAAGHIPGARNRFFKDNLGADGHFASAADLHAAWAPLLHPDPSAPSPIAVHYCGSGVTACHNLLAAAHAGLGIGTLYPGSWSEWSSQPQRPQAQG